MAQATLRQDQIHDLAFYINNPRCFNLSDPGTGKTPTTAVYIEYLWKHKNVKTQWVMPSSLLKKNKDELLRFTDLKPEQVCIFDGSIKKLQELMCDSNIVCYLMGFGRQAKYWKQLTELQPQATALLVDEFHLGGYKSPTSMRSTEMFAFGRRNLSHFLAMDGSLIAGRLDSCYSAIHMVEPRYYAGHWAFLAQHAIMDDYQVVLGWTNHEKLGRIFMRHGVRHTFEEVHGDQEVVFIKERCEVTPSVRKVYSEFEKMALLELEDSFLDGSNPAVNAMRCRQLLAHPHSMGIPGWKPNVLTGKEERLEVLLSDHTLTGKPFIVYASLQPEQERLVELCKSWGFKVGLINANVSPADRAKIDEAFRNGELDGIVGSPATASVGFNWGHVDHVIFVSVDYQDTNFSQAFKRAIRGVRTTPLRISVMEYENTIEQRMFFIVDKKSRDLNRVDPTYKILTLSKI